MQFFTFLQEKTALERSKLQSLPIVHAALAGTVSREQYLDFLQRAYHHVRHTPSLLMACGARIPVEQDWLRAALAHYIAEEVGHHEWILNDVVAAGGDADRVRKSRPDFATDTMITFAYDTVLRRNPVGFFGMVYVLEGTSVQLASRVATSVQRSLGLPREAFTYLNSHGNLDQQHIGDFERLVNRLETDDDRRAVLESAKVFFRLYANVLRDVGIEEAA